MASRRSFLGILGFLLGSPATLAIGRGRPVAPPPPGAPEPDPAVPLPDADQGTFRIPADAMRRLGTVARIRLVGRVGIWAEEGRTDLLRIGAHRWGHGDMAGRPFVLDLALAVRPDGVVAMGRIDVGSPDETVEILLQALDVGPGAVLLHVPSDVQVLHGRVDVDTPRDAVWLSS